MSPSLLRDGAAALPRVSFSPFSGSSPPPSQYVRLQVRLSAQPGAAPLARHMRPSAPDPAGPGLGARGMVREDPGFARIFFFLNKKP